MSKKKLVPRLRFPEFRDSGKWEERKLGKLGTTYTGLSGKTKEDFGRGNARFITYLNVFNNPFANTTAVGKVEIDSKQNEVKYGDILFTTSSETPEEVGMSSVWLHTAENIYLNSFCFGFRLSAEVSPYYMAFMLRSPAVRAKITLLSQGISRYNISKIKLMEIAVPLPLFSEQQKIADCLSSLDDLIAAENKKLEALRAHKKGLMQKLFPAEGQTVPEWRFPGFNSNWQLTTFNKIFEFHQTNSFSRSEMNSENGKVKNIHYGDILTKYGYVIYDTSVIPYINESVDLAKYRDNSYLKNGDIIIADTAEDLTAGKAVEIQNVNCKILAGMHTMLCRPQNTTAPSFFGYFLNSPVYHNSIKPLLVGTKVFSISKSSISKTKIVTPELSEQQKISDCLSSIDDQISAQKEKTETLKLHKKGLMQGLFPPAQEITA